jgi:hypothetical protein
MQSPFNVLVFAVLAAGAALTQAAPARVQAPPRAAINPQPLPPRHVDAGVRDVINPQPLPPRRGGSVLHDQINPQPLPPRTPDATARDAVSRAYIGETEKN